MSHDILTAKALIEILQALPDKQIPVVVARKNAFGIYTTSIIYS